MYIEDRVEAVQNNAWALQTIKMIPSVLESEMLDQGNEDQKDGATHGPFLKWSPHSVLLLATPASGGSSITKLWTELYLSMQWHVVLR